MPPKSQSKTRTIHQTLIDDVYPPIRVQDEVVESSLTEEMFNDFFQDCPIPRFVGLAPIYTQRGSVCRLAIATATKVMIVQFHSKGKAKNAYLGREVLNSQLLCSPDVTLLAFDLNKLTIALFHDQDLRILNGVDIQSACGSDREPLAAIQFAVQDRADVNKDNIVSVFRTSRLEEGVTTTPFALQAWAAHCMSIFEGMEERFRSAKMINTKDMTELVRS